MSIVLSGFAVLTAAGVVAVLVLALLGLFFLVFAANAAALTYLVPFLQHVTVSPAPR